MQCPACGATNPENAQWCGQCLTRFTAAAPQPAPERAPPVDGPPPSADAPAPEGQAPDSVAPTAPAPAQATAAGAFRRVGDDLQWQCPSCDQYNPIEDVACATCGTPFVERFAGEADAQPPQNYSQALVLSAIAPGAGHMAIGHYGTGVGRLVLFVTWLTGAILLGPSGGAGRAVIPLLLGAAAIWALSLADLQRLRDGKEELLVGRRLLWLVLGVLFLLGVALVSSAFEILR